jgi:hypothetical protein
MAKYSIWNITGASETEFSRGRVRMFKIVKYISMVLRKYCVIWETKNMKICHLGEISSAHEVKPGDSACLSLVQKPLESAAILT